MQIRRYGIETFYGPLDFGVRVGGEDESQTWVTPGCTRDPAQQPIQPFPEGFSAVEGYENIRVSLNGCVYTGIMKGIDYGIPSYKDAVLMDPFGAAMTCLSWRRAEVPGRHLSHPSAVSLFGEG